MSPDAIFNTLPQKLDNFFPGYGNEKYRGLLSTKFKFTTYPSVKIKTDRVNEITSWCQESFGDDWIWTMLFDCYKFWFKEEKQLTWFVLHYSDIVYEPV